jgi:hypothetical protein
VVIPVVPNVEEVVSGPILRPLLIQVDPVNDVAKTSAGNGGLLICFGRVSHSDVTRKYNVGFKLSNYQWLPVFNHYSIMVLHR